MIIYGTGSAHLKTEQSHSLTCPNCQTKGSIQMSVFRKHGHIFWIPLFPVNKTGYAQCNSCQSMFDKPKNMPEDMRREFETMKSESKGPIWQFVGLLIIAVIIAYGSYSNIAKAKLTQEYAIAPAAGDIYHFVTDEGDYSTFRLESIQNDSAYITLNDYAISKKSGIDEIDVEENYTDIAGYSISLQTLSDMVESEEVYHIDRQD